jgi:predicted nucleotidyltransferase
VTAAGPDVYAALTRVAAAAPGLQMLLLHGSRARNEAHAHSDWDFAYEADPAFDADALLAAFADALHADRIDLVDLDRAGALVRHRVARDRVVLFERTPGRFDRFWLNAVDTWCDLAPILEPLYARVLETLPRMSPIDHAQKARARRPG